MKDYNENEIESRKVQKLGESRVCSMQTHERE